MRQIILILFLALSAHATEAQQYLYLKKSGTTKMKRLSVGDSIGINVSEERGAFLEGRIRAIGTGGLVFDFGTYSLMEIQQIRAYRMELYHLSRAMNRGALVLVGLMVVNGWIDGGVLILPGVLIGSAAVYGASFAVKYWSRPVYDVSDGWRLELIDFSQVDEPFEPQ